MISYIPRDTQKYPEIPGNTQEYPEMPRNARKYTVTDSKKIAENTQSHIFTLLYDADPLPCVF